MKGLCLQNVRIPWGQATSLGHAYLAEGRWTRLCYRGDAPIDPEADVLDLRGAYLLPGFTALGLSLQNATQPDETKPDRLALGQQWAQGGLAACLLHTTLDTLEAMVQDGPSASEPCVFLQAKETRPQPHVLGWSLALETEPLPTQATTLALLRRLQSLSPHLSHPLRLVRLASTLAQAEDLIAGLRQLGVHVLLEAGPISYLHYRRALEAGVEGLLLGPHAPWGMSGQPDALLAGLEQGAFFVLEGLGEGMHPAYLRFLASQADEAKLLLMGPSDWAELEATGATHLAEALLPLIPHLAPSLPALVERLAQGAKALFLDADLGSIAPGRRGDGWMVDANSAPLATLIDGAVLAYTEAM